VLVCGARALELWPKATLKEVLQYIITFASLYGLYAKMLIISSQPTL
jgi:hypothetical protein